MAEELFSPERLQLARQRRGLFVQELAARVGVSSKSLSNWEKDLATPAPEHVDELAKVLEFPREYFFGDVPPTLAQTAFRSLARMTARQRDMALSAGAQAVDCDRWISKHFSRPTPYVPDLRDIAPEMAADMVRAAWGLGYKPIPNLVHLLEKYGVRVYSLVHSGSEIDAFSHWQGDLPFILLNTTKTAERSRMDASHELGHLVLHSHTAGGVTKQHEDEAQRFASAFLMPRAPFISTAPRKVTLPAIVEAKQTWGVSSLAYTYRMHSLGRLSDWQYRTLCIQIKTSHGNSEPGPHRTRECSQVLAKILLEDGDARSGTRRDIARFMRVHLRDLDDLSFGLTLTPMEGGSRSSALSTGAPVNLQLVK